MATSDADFKKAQEQAAAFNVNRVTPAFDMTGQKQETTDYLSRFGQAIPRMSKEIQSSYNIPQLRQQFLAGTQAAGDIQRSISALPETVRGTTQESMVTEAQRAGLVGKQQAQLGRALEATQAATQTAGAGLNIAEQAAQKEIERGLLPFEKEADFMTQQQAREFTGYTFQNQQELSRLLANAANGLKWTDAEAQRANDLAKQELVYKAAIESAKINAESAANQARITGVQNRLTAYQAQTGQSPYADLYNLFKS